MNTTLKNIRIFTGLVLFLFLSACGGGEVVTAGGGTVLANAGDDFEALVSAVTELDGLGSVGVESVAWTIEEQPSGSTAVLSSADTLTPSITPDVAGEYILQLSINGAASIDNLTMTAKNIIAAVTVPDGSAVRTRERFNTSEYVINLGEEGGVLSASASQIAGSESALVKKATIATYEWEQISGPGATQSGSSTAETLTFTAPGLDDFINEADQYKWQVLPLSRDDSKMVFRVTLTDENGNSDFDTAIVYLESAGVEIPRTSGLPNVGVGTVVYLSGPSLKATSASSTAVTDWVWNLSPPADSTTTFEDTSTTSSSQQFPNFTPDREGIFTIAYSSVSAAVSGELLINAANWEGVGTIGGATAVSPQCANCHDGSIEPDYVTGWAETKHASVFSDSMSLYAALGPTPFLWEFHTVGYDPNAVNLGFDDLASDEDFIFPEAGLAFSDFTASNTELAQLSGVQCESCHGPGSQHTGDPLRIAKSASQAGVCGQCHTQETEWGNSRHNSTGVVHGRGAYQSSWVTNAGCVRCHSAKGFANYLDEGEEGLGAVTETGAFPGVTCAGCHDPHDATNEKQLRLAGDVTMIIDDSTVDAGKAATCYSCHDGNYAHGEDDCDSNSDGRADADCLTTDQTATQYYRQVHYNPQAPILEGKGGLTDFNGDGTDDFTLTENSFHSGSTFTLADVTGDASLSATNDKCITCHMATGPSLDAEGYQHLGGHAFKLRVDHGLGHLQGEEDAELAGDAVEAGEEELVSACTSCHASLTTFNRLARDDYDGDGDQEGIQDEVTGLLLALSVKIRSVDTANVLSTSGTIQSGDTISVNSLSYAGTKSSLPTGKNCTTSLPTDGKDVYQPCNFMDASGAVRRAIWNHNLIVRDGSLGIHNAAYTIQLLQKSYTAVGGNTFSTDFPNAAVR